MNLSIFQQAIAHVGKQLKLEIKVIALRLQSDIWIKTNINDCATMSRSKSRHSARADTKDTRLAAAQTFVNGDRVRHKLNGKMGVFAGINLGFALPEVWVVFDS